MRRAVGYSKFQKKQEASYRRVKITQIAFRPCKKRAMATLTVAHW